MMKRIAVLTSGGDSAGMNACIRSVVRDAIYNKLEVVGVMRGYDGLIKGNFIPLERRSASNIIAYGGTILKTARSDEFLTAAGQRKAVETMKKNHIDGLIAIGGDGTFRGAHKLSAKWGIRVIGVPATIDNDVSGTDDTIGADTAVNTALDAIDKIRDTVNSMERIFIVEVMGRDSGYIAMQVGLAGGAEDVLVPERQYDMDAMCGDIMAGRKKGKVSWIIVVAEGVANARDVARKINEKTGFDTRVTVLGHIQRGGSPTADDRVLAACMGSKAVDLLVKGESDKMVGVVAHKMQVVELSYAIKKKKGFDTHLYRLMRILAM